MQRGENTKNSAISSNRLLKRIVSSIILKYVTTALTTLTGISKSYRQGGFVKVTPLTFAIFYITTQFLNLYR